ncbi:MAG: DUF6118 family protein [Gemmobacter sp.]|jgi:hypothetical protein|nr:DUF6118 family protein [Gemmobacter sp.]
MNATNDNTLPAPMPDDDPAAAAFNRLGDEVRLLHAAVTGLAARRDEMPDYSETLGVMAATLQGLRKDMKALAERPAMTLTPETMAQKIAVSGQQARAEDHAALRQARNDHAQAVQSLNQIIGNAHSVADQKYLQRLWGGCGLALGVLIWMILPGMIARELPASWLIPERMARHMMGEPTLWQAGARLMHADPPRPATPAPGQNSGRTRR